MLFFTILSSVSCAVEFLFLFLSDRLVKTHKKFALIAITLVTVLSIICTYQSYKLERKDNIGKTAENILKNKYYHSNETTIEMYLSFLEKYKEDFPDSYKRACYIESHMVKDIGSTRPDSMYRQETAELMIRGIIVGIAVSGEK